MAGMAFLTRKLALYGYVGIAKYEGPVECHTLVRVGRGR
jgi:hypothetical protein